LNAGTACPGLIRGEDLLAETLAQREAEAISE
jgi:hypothetical protein